MWILAGFVCLCVCSCEVHMQAQYNVEKGEQQRVDVRWW